MKDLFNEYAWFLIALLGGFLGLGIFMQLSMGEDAWIGQIVRIFLGGLM